MTVALERREDEGLNAEFDREEWRFSVFSIRLDRLQESEKLRRVAQGAVLAMWADGDLDTVKAALESERGAALRMRLEDVREPLAEAEKLARLLESLVENVRLERSPEVFINTKEADIKRTLHNMDDELVGLLGALEKQMRLVSRELGPKLDWLAGICEKASLLGYQETSAHRCLCRFAGHLVDHVARCIGRGEVLEPRSARREVLTRPGAPDPRKRDKPSGPEDLRDDDRAILAALFGEPKTQQEIAGATGLSLGRVSSRTPELQRWDLIAKVAGKYGFVRTAQGEAFHQALQLR